ncbi:MAG: hypothetical protein HFJ55_00635 [Clostridia bacterium]|nr:hypothetical protein [Clostridia bacterium]
MKANFKARVRDLTSIPMCWLYKDGKYIFMKEGQIGNNLPTAEIKDKQLLEEMSIPYCQISDKLLEYWSPKFYEKEEVTLPVYISYQGEYRLVKNHTGSVITKETQYEAYAIKRIFLDALKKKKKQCEREKMRMEKLISKLVSTLDGQPAIGICRYTKTKRELIYGGGTLRLVPVYTIVPSKKLNSLESVYEECQVELPEITWKQLLIETNYTLVVDMNKLPRNGILDINVPAGKEGLFVGRDGWQVKEWCTEFGLRQIHIKTI